MRPATAISKKSQATSRSIWKKYQTIKPQKNNFYCFKTITQILQAHKKKPLKDDKKQFYYHRISSPKNQLTQGPLQKENSYRRITNIVQRNPNIKKVLSNNFFSTKEIGKQNTDYLNVFKTKTQNQIKNGEKFLPYRQQSISIIKHSKILSETETVGKQQVTDIKKDMKCEDRSYKQKTMLKQRQKTRHIESSCMAQKQIQQMLFKDKNEFVIEQWDNFEQDGSNFSILISNANHLN